MRNEDGKEECIFKKCCFWTTLFCIILIICTIVMICIGILNQNETTRETSKREKRNDTISNSYANVVEEKKIENTYEITNDYDGTYKFIITEGSGIIIGAINIDGGNIKTKYSDIDSSYTIPVYNGFCGLNKEDNSVFYISIMNNSNEKIREFKCTKSDKNLIGESMTGTAYKKVDFIYVNDDKDIEKVYDETLKQEKEKEEQNFKASCGTYTFEQMARNPENFKGTNVKITGEVVQALYGSNSVNLRVNITKKGSYSTYYTDTIYAVYDTKPGEDKILENDIVTMWGTAEGDYSYTSVMGSVVTLPRIDIKYIQINKE